jgi:hypothetical protein
VVVRTAQPSLHHVLKVFVARTCRASRNEKHNPPRKYEKRKLMKRCIRSFRTEAWM